MVQFFREHRTNRDQQDFAHWVLYATRLARQVFLKLVQDLKTALGYQRANLEEQVAKSKFSNCVGVDLF